MASKSLGTLTVDLVARTASFVQGMSKAERASEKWRKSVADDLKTIGSVAELSFAGLTTAASGMAALTALAAKNIDSQAKLARSLNTTYDSISQLQHAFGDSGVDGFEASITRLNRRLGAAELGRGAAVNAVKELGLNLKELASVDAAERVAIIADRIKQVSTNSQMAARFAQDLGFEQKEAAQFFMQGGDAIRQQAQYIRDMGLALSDVDAAKVELAAGSMANLKDLTWGAAQNLAVSFSPAIKAVTDLIVDARKEVGNLQAQTDIFADRAVKGFGFALNAVDGLVRTTQLAGMAMGTAAYVALESIALVASGTINAVNRVNNLVDSLTPMGTVKKLLGLGKRENAEAEARFKSALNNIKAAFGKFLDDSESLLMKSQPGDKLAAAYEKAKKSIQAAAEALAAPQRGGGDYDPTAGVEKQAASVEKLGQTYLELMSQFDATYAALLRYEETVEKIKTSQADATQQAELMALAMQRLSDDVDAATASQENLGRSYQSLLAQVDPAWAALERYNAFEKEVLESTANTTQQTELLDLAMKQLSETIDSLQEKEPDSFWDNWLASAENALTSVDDLASSVIDQFTQGFGNAFEQMIFDSQSLGDAVRNMAEGMLRTIVNTLGQMAAQWMAYALVQKLVNSQAAAAAAPGLISRAVVGQQQAALNAYASTAAIPVVGPALAPMAAATAMASTMPFVTAITGAALTGIAHDGMDYIPTEGTWLLDEGERVVDARTNRDLKQYLNADNRKQDGGGVVVNLHEDSRKAGRVEESEDEKHRTVIDIFVADILGDGRAATAISTKWGLAAQGY